MLPRRLILEHCGTVKRGMLVRYPPVSMYLCDAAVEMLEAIDMVKELGNKSIDLLHTIEGLREDRNKLAGSFQKATKEEREVLKQQSLQIKEKLPALEKEHFELERTIGLYEAIIPNVPAADVPLWAGCSEFDEKCIRTNLEYIHNLISEYSE